MSSVRVGILDSGLAGDMATRAVANAAFSVGEDFTVAGVPWQPDVIGHGTAVARLVAMAAPEAELFNAQIFVGGRVASAAAAAAGLDWLRRQGACLVSMSFGLRQDREALRRACMAATEAGMVLVGAAPARGEPVFPAAYPAVIAVTGDARCAPGEISVLDAGLLFGACPRSGQGEGEGDGLPVGGSSFAVGHLCGLLAAAMAGGEVMGPAGVLPFLDSIARYRGRERKGRPGG